MPAPNLVVQYETTGTMNDAQNHQTLSSTYFIDGPNVDRVYQSIIPELETIGIAGARSSVRIHKTASKLVINIKAADISSCRAATNSWLRLALVATEIDELVADMLEK